MIMILLNLAFVPDSVVTDKEMNFEPGWYHYFKLRMKNVQRDFNDHVDEGGRGRPIEYQLVQCGD